MRAAGWLLVLAGCVTTPPPVVTRPPAPAVDPHAAQRAVVRAFVQATDAHRFEEAWALLARPLRDRYTAARLAEDFEAEPLAAARLEQLKRRLDGPFADSNTLAWAEGKALRLTLEPDGWRIAALE